MRKGQEQLLLLVLLYSQASFEGEPTQPENYQTEKRHRNIYFPRKSVWKSLEVIQVKKSYLPKFYQ
jgi:hypothetical protein